MGATNTKESDRRIEEETRRKYSGATYKPDTVMRRSGPDSDYFNRIAKLKIALVRENAKGRRVLDLCCATADHLFAIADLPLMGVGLDFSLPFLKHAVSRLREQRLPAGPAFICGNARRLPFADASFGLVYSFSSLYYVPRVGESLAEIGRVLEPGGIAILDLGNLWSLNTFVSRSYAETSAPFHLSPARMKQIIAAAGLQILEHRAFQILPLWGNRPRWLRPLLHPFWKRLMEKTLGGRMIDEWLCRLPGVRSLAFRHLFVCRRKGKTP
jgi:SAM-dependent methyltransferase